jgi:hypothetical protein
MNPIEEVAALAVAGAEFCHTVEAKAGSPAEKVRWRFAAALFDMVGTAAYRHDLDDDARPQPVDLPTRYVMPGVPPIETELIDNRGDRWKIAVDPFGTHYAELLPGPDVDQDEGVTTLAWHQLLAHKGPLTVCEQDPEDARLYGPWGARWGRPDHPCPFYATQAAEEPSADGEGLRIIGYAGNCALGVGHVGPHVDPGGNPLNPASPTPYIGPVSISPAQASETPCDCGNPAEHQPGCPRYARTTGHAPTDYHEEPPF